MTMRLKKSLSKAACLFLSFLMLLFFVITATAESSEENAFNVKAVMQEGEHLIIEIHDIEADETSVVRVNINDYPLDSEYITIQALSLDGKKSQAVKVRNPYHVKGGNINTESIADSEKSKSDDVSANISTSGVPSNGSETVPVTPPITNEANTFTPNGQAGVLDFATESEGKEFYTISTANDDTFYMIIDKNRTSDNVYFLNTVTENDLMALAEKNGTSISKPKVEEPEVIEKEPIKIEEPEPEPVKKGGGNTLIIVIGVVAIAVVLYVMKVKPMLEAKKNAEFEVDEDEEYESNEWDDEDDDDEYYDNSELESPNPEDEIEYEDNEENEEDNDYE